MGWPLVLLGMAVMPWTAEQKTPAGGAHRPAATRAACVQGALKAMGVAVDLKSFNLEIRDALVRCANQRLVTTTGAVIEQGLKVQGRLNFSGLYSDVLVALEEDGMDLNAALDFSGISDKIASGAQSALDS